MGDEGEGGRVATGKRPITWFELGVRNAGIRATITATNWAYGWAVVREAVGHEPTAEQVAEWWKMSRRTAFRDQAAFRKAFPKLESPGPMYASAEERAAVAKHAAFGDRMDQWFKERQRNREADSVHVAMLPADAGI